MSNTTLGIDSDVLRAATLQAIMQQLGSDGRQKLLEKTLDSLMREKVGHSSQTHFEQVLFMSTKEIVREEVAKMIAENPDIIIKIRSKISEAVGAILENQDLINKFSAAFVSGMQNGKWG